MAGIISGALAIGGLSLAPLFSEITVPEAQAAEPVSHQEGTPVWTLSTRLEAVWPQPLDDQSFYHASGSTPGGTVGNVSTVLFQDYGWSEDLSTYKIRPALQFKRIASGGTFTDGVLQTQAMARIGGTSAAPVASTNPAAVRGPAAPLTVYFWNNTGQQSNGEATCPSGHATILRVTSGDKNIYWSCMPISRATGNGGFNPGIDTGHATGGEADQYSGNVYVVGHFNASIDDQSSTSRAASTEAGWVFTVWNPLTGAYALSGSVQPGDWYQGMTTVPKERIKVRANVVGTGNDDPSAPADFALDADGNVYVYSGAEVTASSAANASIVRMEPARNATGDIVDGTAANPWRYYVVTKLKKDPAFPAATWSDAGSVYGNAFLNGQLFLGAYTNVGGTGSYGLPSSASAGPRGTTTIIKIDPLAATMRPVWSVQNDGLTNDTARDNASPQQAAVIRGTLYNDADGDGVISRAEDTLEGQKVAIYDATGKLRAVNETDAKGNYSFIVPWSAGTVYYIRPVQIQIPAADGVTLINAAQTWGAGSVEVGYSSTGTALTNTAAIQCANGNITSELGAACHGAKLPGSSDPALGVVGSTSASSDWLTYAKVTINTSQAVPNADFAFTVRGSYGDAPAGPTTSNVPVHVNQPTASVWLGDNLGSYGGPAADAAAHNGTDDGLYLNSYAGAVPLQGTMLASTKQYQLAATVSGSAADSAKVQAWTTGVGNNTWTTTPKWTPTISGGVATGSFQFQTSGATTGTPTVQLRADVSTATISLPTNSSGQYAAGTAGTPSWTTAGEIEDYTIQVADTVYRPAARTTSGSGTFSVDALSLTADNTAFTIGTAKAAAAGAPKTVTATTPNSSWTVASVAIKDVETGAVKYTPTTSTTGNNTTISWTPTLGDDVVVEVIFSKNPDPAKSTLTLDKESATVGSNITATATIVDADGNPLQNVTVSWAKASADTSISGPTCVTEADGTCFVTITSNVAKTYTDELTAKVNVSGTATQISGSPKTVTFTPGDATAEKSDLAVSPAGPLVVGTGAANTYTATTTARDGNDNLSPNQTIEYTVTKADGSAVDPAKTALSATSCSTSAVVGANYGKCNVTLTSKESGSFLIHATVGGTDVNDSPATVVYTPGSVCIPSATVTCDPDPDKRTEIRVTVDNSPADGESPDIVQARAFDAEGNAIEGAVFTLATTDSTLTVSPLTISTGEDGTVTTDATSQVAGGHQLTGKVNGADLTTQAGSPLTVHFEAGEPDKDQSTLVLSASTATVGAPITATATVKDATGNPLDGRDVTFAITNHGTFGAAADPAVTTATCTTTLPSGACSVTFTDPKVESVEVSAEIMIEGAMTGVSGSPASASFTQGTPKTDCVDPTNPNAEKPNVSATPTTLSVGNDSAVRAYVTDEFCNPVSGVAVDFGVDGSASLADASKQTGSDGVANTTVTDDVAQTVHVTAGFGTHTLPGSPAQVTFEAGDPDPDQSSVALDRASQTVGSSIIATVTVKDAQGNLLDGKDAYVSVTGSATTDGLEGAASTSSCTTDQSGTCTVTIDDKVAEDIWVAATLGSATGPEVSNSPLAATFVPADVDFDKSTFAVDQLDLLVNTNATGTATVVDEFNNAIEGAVVTFGTSLSGNLSASTCTTLDTGKCTVTLTDAVAETVAFSAKIGTDDLNGSPKSVRFKTGGIHVLNSDFTVSPAGPLVADGADFYTGTLTARDADNNLIKDLDLALILFGASSDDVVVSSPVVNHGDGTYTVTYRTTVASPHYTAQVFVDGAQIGGNEPIPFTAGAANAEHSRLAVDPTSLGVGGTSTATVTLRDIHDNLVGGTAADLSVTGAAALANPSCTTNNVFTDTAFGTCSVTLTDNVAETVTVTATLNGDTIPVPTAVTFVVGGVSDKYSDITVAPSQQVVGAAVTVTVKVRDDSNNAINDLTADKFVITTTGDDSQPALAMTGFTPLANGVYTFQTTSKIVGTFTFAAVVDSVPLSERPTAKFTNAGVCVQNCETIDGPNGATRFEMAVNDQLANGTAADKATAYARDTYGNAVPDATVSVVDKTTGVNAGVLSPETATCTTGSDGTCQASWTATSVGTYTGEGTIASLAPGDGSGILNQIRFTNGAANPANSELVVTPTSLPIDTTATATVTVRDNEGILIPGAVVSFSLEDAITGTGQPALNETTCTTGSDGTCFVTLTSSLAGETKVHATLPNGSGVATDLGGNGDQTKGSPVTVTFTPGPVCYSNCHPIDPTHTTRVEVTVNGSEANGSALDVATAYAYDDKGNAVPGVPVATGTTDVALNVLTPTASTGPDGTVALNYSSSVAGDHKATATIDSVVPSGSPLTLTFGSGTADPAHSFLTVSPAGPIKVDETYTITAHANDATNNPVDGAVVAFQIPGELSADQTSCTSVAGVCFITVTTTVAGSYDVGAELSNGALSNSPVTVVFEAGAVCTAADGCVKDPDVDAAHTTRVELTVNGSPADGSTPDVAVVHAFDKHGNAVKDAVVTSTTSDAALAVSTIAPTLADGSTTIQYKSVVAGEHVADVRVDGMTPEGSPVRPAFASQGGVAANSSWDITPAGPLVVGTGADATYTASITVRDVNNNAVDGAIVTLKVAQPGVTFPDGATCQTDGSGQCTVDVSSTTAGTFEFTAMLGSDQIGAAKSRAWSPDEVCAQASGCTPVPGVDADHITRVEVTDNGHVADGAQRDYATVYAFDQYGNAVSGALVQSTTADAGLNIQTGIAGTFGNGTQTIWYTSKVAGDHEALVTVAGKIPANGKDDTGSVTLTFIPGAASAEKSTLTVDSNSVLVNDTVTATATIRDINENVITGAVVTFGKSGAASLSAPTCETIADGTCTVTLTDATAETVQLSATIPVGGIATAISGSPQSIAFDAKQVSGLESTFTVAPAGPLVADGTAFYTGTFTARDENTNVLTALDLADIVFGASSEDVVVSSPVVNHGDGTYTVTFKTTVASPNYKATLNYVTMKIGADEPIPFKAGDVDPSRSGLAVDPTSLGVGGTSTATVTLRDAYDNLVGDESASFAVTGNATASANTCETNNVYTDAAYGTCSVTLTDDTAETVTVTAKYGSVVIPSPTDVTFVVGAVSDKYSDITVAPSEQTVGAAVTVTVKVRDDSNNAINDLTADKFVITTTGDDSQPELVLSHFTPLANGVYTFQTTSKIVGTFTFAAVVDSVPLSERPTAKFTNGGVCVENCDTTDGPNGATRFEMAVNDQLANGVAADKATAYARDTYGNAVPDALVSVVDKTTGVNAGVLSPATATCTTGSDGTCQVSWTAMSVGTYTGEGKIAGLAPADGSGILSQIRFTNGAANPANSDLVVTPTSLVIEHTATATVTVRDNEGILVPGAVVSFSLEDDITGVGQPTLSETTCTTGPDGTCFVTLTSSLAGETKVHATLPNSSGVPTDLGGNGDDVKGSPQTVTFTPDVVCFRNCDPIDPTHVTHVAVTVNGSEANGTATDVATAYAYDHKGNPVPGIAVGTTTSDAALRIVTATASPTGPDGTTTLYYTSTVAGSHKANVTIDSNIPAGSPVDLVFGSGTADPSRSTLTVSPASPIKVDETYTITAHINDATDNPVDGAFVAFQIPSGLSASASSCTTVAGVCFITVTTTVAGSYNVGAELSNGALSNSPVTVVFEAGAVCTAADGCVKDPDVDAAHTTRVELTVNGSPADGSTPDVAVVHAFDKHGNAVKDAVVTSTTSDAALAISTIAPTLADGSTTIQYKSTVAGEHVADVRVDGLTPEGSPVRPAFASQGGVAANSSWDITPAGPLVVGTGADATYTASITVRDVNNNAVDGAIVTIKAATAGVTYTDGDTCTTDDLGTCTVDFTSTKAGTYEFTAMLGSEQIGVSRSRAWSPDEVCAQASGCTPVPGVDADHITRVEVTENGKIADGAQRDYATVYAFDQYGNAVSGALVQSTTTDADLNIQTGIAGTLGNGTQTIWYTSKVAGGHEALVTVAGKIPANGKDDTGSVTLTFVPGAASAEKSTLVVSPSTLPAGDSATVIATIRDINENAITGAVVTFGKNGSSTLSDTTCTTVAGGACTVQLTDKVKETVQVSATISVAGLATPISGSPATVTFTNACVPGRDAGCVTDPSVDNAHRTRVEVTTDYQREDGEKDVATVYYFDSLGNAVEDGVVRSQTTATTLSVQAAPADTNAFGESTIDYTSTVAGAFPADVSLDGVAVVFHPQPGSAEDTPEGAAAKSSPITLHFVDVTAPDAPIILHPSDGDLTNDRPLVVDGTAEPGSTVEVVDKTTGETVCTTTADASGNWTCDVNLPDGDHTLVASSTDDSGNRSVDSDQVDITVDTTAPDAPRVDVANGVEVSGDPGSSEPGATIEITWPDGTTDTTVVNPDGSWTIPTPDGMPSGEIEVTATDPAGNTSPVTTEDLDTEAPEPPRVDVANGTEVSGGPGSSEPGATIEITWPDGTTDTTVVNPDGSWTIPTPDGMPSGEIEVTATDPAGNTSDPTVADLDTEAPDAPRVDVANGTEVSGGSGSSEPGATIEVTWPDGTTSTTTVDPDGSWTIPTPDGIPSGEIEVTATDPAGNTSDPTVADLDTEAPDAPRVDVANGTEVSGGSGSSEPGATIEITWPDGTTDTTVVNPDGSWTIPTPDGMPSGEIEVTATDPAGNTSDPTVEDLDTEAPEPPRVDVANGTEVAGKPGSSEPGATIEITWPDGTTDTTVVNPDGSWTIPTPDGMPSGEIVVTATDPAGNTSDPTVADLDTEAPDAPRVDVANGTEVSGGSGSSEPGATIEITWPDGTASTTTVDPDGSWTIPTPDGMPSGEIEVTATDPAGNTSNPTVEDLDTLAPDAPVIKHGDKDTISGTAEPGSTVTVTVPGVSTPVDVVTGADGTWSIPTPDEATSGYVTAVATDPAGNFSDPSVPFWLDLDAPGAPSITTANGEEIGGVVDPDTNDPGDTIIVTDGGGNELCKAVVQADMTWSCKTPDTAVDGPITAVAVDENGNVSEPGTGTLDVTPPAPPRVDVANGTEVSGGRGASEPGATIEITWPDGTTDTTTVNPDGSWTIDTPDGMPSGQIEVTATDPAGNESKPTKEYLDTEAPDAPIIDVANGTEVSGTSEPGATVEVTWPDGSTSTTTVDPDGTWRVDTPAGMEDGEVTAVATDPAGNHSDKTFADLDTTPPTTPTIDVANGTEVSGTGEPGSTITVTWPDDTTTTTKVDPDGTWSVDTPDGMPSGDVTAEATDPAGNHSPSVTEYLDTDAPQPPVLDPSNGTVITGKAEPDSTITITDVDGNVITCQEGTVKAGADGGFKCTPVIPLAPDTVVNVTATDEAGNTSKPALLIIGELGIWVEFPVRNAGENEIVVGVGFVPGETVTLEFCTTCSVVGTGVADAGGVVTITFQIPEGTPGGNHTVRLTGDKSSPNMGSVETTFVVTIKVNTGGSVMTSGGGSAGAVAALILLGLGATAIGAASRKTKVGA